MIEKLEEIKNEAQKEISSCNDEVTLNNIKSKYLGKKSAFTEIMSNMSSLSQEEKREVGSKSNEVRTYLQELLENKLKEIKDTLLTKQLEKDKIDITLPSKKRRTGTLHPLTQVRQEIEDLFISMGYDVVDGPEIDTDANCFELLNLPASHPA